MKKNDLFSLKITDMGVDGEGIGKYDGMTSVSYTHLDVYKRQDVYNPFRGLWVLPAANSVVCEPSSNNAVPPALCCILYNHQQMCIRDRVYLMHRTTLKS